MRWSRLSSIHKGDKVKPLKQIPVMIFLVLTLAACNLPQRSTPTRAPRIDQALVGTIAAMTLESMATPTPPPTSTFTPTVAMTATQTSTVTPTYSAPVLLFNGNTNCRKGPGEAYEVVIVVRTGQKVEAVGRLEKTTYWLVKRPDKAETCWVSDDFAQASGSIHILPTVTAPPVPTPKPPTGPGWQSYNYTCDFASGGSNINMNLVWTDRSNDEVGYIVYRDGQAIANLGPDSTSFTDVAFVAAGQSVSYKIEVYNKSGTASSSTISATCQ
jgi:hypothetical protein